MVDISCLTMIIAIVLIGQQFLLFDGRLLCLCASAFYAIGAYASGLMAKQGALPVYAAIPTGALVAAAVSLPVGWALLRHLRSDFFALATLGLAQVVLVILRVAAPGGVAGLAGLPPMRTPLADVLPVRLEQALLIGSICAACLAGAGVLRRRRFGVLLMAVGADENAVRSSGYRPALVLTQAFAVASFLAALAGALQAHFLGVVEPAMASIQMTVVLLLGTIVAGGRRTVGSLLGALVVVAVPRLLEQLFRGPSGTPWQVFPATQILFAGLLIGLVFFRCFRADKAGQMGVI